MSKSLPERPDLGQLKTQAKELLAALHAAQPEALARLPAGETPPPTFALHDAQRIVAREHGFPNWAKLKLHVETRTIEMAEMRLIAAALEGEAEVVEAILAERPALGRRSLAAAAALGHGDAIAGFIATPSAVAAKTGPRGWPPLLYLCFGRCGAGDAARAAAAEALLAAGADPNSSWTSPEWPESAFPALYGAAGVNNYPRLARALLQAGANPNDSESKYHAAEHHHVACLEVLAEFGADFSRADQTWGNTPLYFLFSWHNAAPAARAGIRWLLEHGADPNALSYPQAAAETALHAAVRNGWEPDMVELLLRHGADPRTARGDGRSALALAVCHGRDDLVDCLGGSEALATLADKDLFLGACMRGDPEAARRIVQRKPEVLAQLLPDDRALVHAAAQTGRASALRVMGHYGFDLGATDAEGATPLHVAAWHGWKEATAALIALGVPLDRCDGRFGAPPIGWCAHGSQFYRNPAGDYAAVAEALIAAGAPVPKGTQGGGEVMAVLRSAAARDTAPPP